MSASASSSTSSRGSASDVVASRANPLLFWGVILVVVVLDLITKAIAVYALAPAYMPHDIVGEYLRLTLVYNRGAAFGLHFGEFSRWIFMALTVVALTILGRMYRNTVEGAFARTLAIALVCGGAVGNLIDRIRSSAGVVDFIDVGIGAHRWPTFNVADMAVSTGAALLVWVMLQEDRAAARAMAAEHE